MSEIKAIETVYNGYKFRSRLEARWAVFFDAAGIKYEYEPQGFELSDGTKYLPDFYLPDYRYYVEVKPNRDGAVDEINKACKFIGDKIQALLILGNIPEKTDVDIYHYPAIYYNSLRRNKLMEYVCVEQSADNKLGFVTLFSVDRQRPIIAGRFTTYEFEAIHDKDMYAKVFGNTYSLIDCRNYRVCDIKFINSCYDAARQVRFEHGQTPKPNVSINQPTKIEINNTETTVKRNYRKVMNEFKPKNEYELDAIRKYSIAIDQIVKVNPSIRHMLQRGIVCDVKHDIPNKSCLICIGYGRGEIIIIKLLEGRKNQIEETLTKVFNEKVYIEFVELESGESA